METRTVLVCGGRDFSDTALVESTLDRLHEEVPIKAIIHGGASGADTIARLWAQSKGIWQRAWIPNWGRDRGAAGPIRNRLMLQEGKPDLVVAFPGGRGTADMIRQARNSGFRVFVVPVHEETDDE